MKHNNEDFYVVISGTEEIGEPIFTAILPFQTLDSEPTNAFFKSKTEYYDGSNLSDMIYPYNFCCVEVFGRDLYGKLRQNIKLPPLFRRRHK